MNNSTEKIPRDHRPWGYYDILAERQDCRIKGIVVFPGNRMSLQKHRHRSEHWFVIRGTGLVTVGESDRDVSGGDSIDIPAGSVHRVSNPGKEELVIIEVQTGSYFGEDDIERIADDYGRQTQAVPSE